MPEALKNPSEQNDHISTEWDNLGKVIKFPGAKIQSERIVNDAELELPTISREEATEVLASAEAIANQYIDEKVNIRNSSEIFIGEKTKFNSLIGVHETFQAGDNEIPSGYFGELDYHKRKEANLKELSRYGFDPNRHFNSPEVEAYQSPTFSNQEILNFGKQRAGDYSELVSLNGGKYGKAVRAALKAKGFKELPKNWSDENFTTYEMSLMSQIAQGAVKNLTYK